MPKSYSCTDNYLYIDKVVSLLNLEHNENKPLIKGEPNRCYLLEVGAKLPGITAEALLQKFVGD